MDNENGNKTKSSMNSRNNSKAEGYTPARVSDLDLYTYLKRLSVISQKLAAEGEKKRELNEQNVLTSQLVESTVSKLPKSLLKALMNYFKQLALSQSQADKIDPNLKRTYLAFYAQLLEMKSSKSEDLEVVGQSADLLIVKFLACVSKVAGPNLVSVQGSLFVELLRTLVKKQGGNAALDSQLALKQQSFSEVKRAEKPVKDLGNLDVGDIAEHLSKVMLVSPTLFQRDMAQENWITLEGVSRFVDHMVNNVQNGQMLVYSPHEFQSIESYNQAVEPGIKQLQQLQTHLPQSTSFEEQVPEIVPNNIRDYFSLLLERCIESDLKSATLFTGKTRKLLQFVIKFWCISLKTRVSCLLYTTTQMYSRKMIGVQTIFESYDYAFHLLRASEHEDEYNDKEEWPANDKLQAATAVDELRQILIDQISSAMRQLFKKPPKIGVLIELTQNQIYHMAKLLGYNFVIKPSQVKQIKLQIQAAAEEEYDRLVGLIPRDNSLEVDHIVQLMESILSSAQKMQNKYKFPILDKLPIAVIVCSVHLKLLSSDFLPIWEFCSKQNELNEREPSFDQMQALHDCSTALLDLNSQVSDEIYFKFDLEALIFPYYLTWVESSGEMSKNWVKPAIEQDTNQPIDLDHDIRYSSAVQDLFKSFYASISVIENMNWQAEYYQFILYTNMVKYISDTICTWAGHVQQVYFANLNLVDSNGNSPQKPDDQWLAQAAAVMSSKSSSPQPFSFKTEEGVRLNNISAAFNMLHDFESRLQADKVCAEIQAYEKKNSTSPVVRKKKGKGSVYLFTVTIIGAKNLELKSGASSIYATVMDQDNRRQVGKTRTVQAGNVMCKWNDTFEIKVLDLRPKLLKVTLWFDNPNTNTNHVLCGRAMVKLDPKEFVRKEYGMHIFNIDLDGTAGQLQVLVAADVEQDDIRFYFGRALRFLKRTQDSMVNAVVTQFSSYISSVLSKQTLKEVTGQGSLATTVQSSVNQIQKGLSMLWGKESSSSSSHKRSSSASVVASGSAASATDNLEPLYDYLNANFATLAGILTPELRIEVLSRTWDVVLETLELLILPPLDSTPTSQVQLTSAELEALFCWLSSLRDFFYSDGAGPSLERLQSQSYQQIMAIPVYYDLPTQQLKIESEKIVKQNLRALASNSELVARQRTVMAHRNRSVIEHQSRELRIAQRSTPKLDDVVLRILRMRGESAFIEQHLKFRERLLQREMTERALQGSLFKA